MGQDSQEKILIQLKVKYIFALFAGVLQHYRLIKNIFGKSTRKWKIFWTCFENEIVNILL